MLKNIQIKKLLFIIVIVFLVSFFYKNMAIAQTTGGSETTGGSGETTTGGGETTTGGNETTKGGKEKVFLDNPITGSTSSTTPSTLFSRIIKLLLGGVGTLSLVVFIYGGGVWLTSRGNQEQVKKGKDVFIYAIIGLAVVFASYAILNLIISALTG